MSIFYPYFTIALIVGILGATVPNLHVLATREYRYIRNRYRLQTILISGSVVMFSAFRVISAASIDEYAYRRRFIKFAGLDFVSAMRETTEPVFSGIVWLSTRLFSTDQGIIIITSFLTVLLLLGAIKKYSSDYSFACIILFASGVLYTTFNGIQQYLAAAVMVYTFEMAYNKKLKEFLFLVIICTLIHNASIFLIMFYYLADEEIGSKKMWLYNIIFLMIGLFFYRAIPVIAEKYGIFAEYVDKLTAGHHGVQNITILINLVPAFIAIILKKNLVDDKVTTAFANITILHAMIYMLAKIDVYIARLAIFTAPYTVIFLSRIMGYIKEAAIMKLLAVVLYTVVCYLQLRGIIYNFNFVL